MEEKHGITALEHGMGEMHRIKVWGTGMGERYGRRAWEKGIGERHGIEEIFRLGPSCELASPLLKEVHYEC